MADAVVIGAGPAGLMAAETLAQGSVRVVVHDTMPRPGRKFLLAGRGGLNLTHSEPLPQFMQRYGPASDALAPAVAAFSPQAVRDWCEVLGEPTFVGSSGRVFPKSLKASPLLRAWLRRLDAAGVAFRPRSRWVGWSADGALLFDTPQGLDEIRPSVTVLALGGASWPRLGSDGAGIGILRQAGIGVAPLTPANSGVAVEWSALFRERFQGQPLKRIALSAGDCAARGEAMVTADGLEGGAVYALTPAIRRALHEGACVLGIDLRPDRSAADLAARLAAPRGKQSLSNYLRKTVSLPPVAIALLRESQTDARLPDSPEALAALIKRVPVTVAALSGLARAISTAGGVAFDDIDAGYMLTKMPGVFVAGEMLDWEAPTGGYLLQACFATGVAAGRGALGWLKSGGQADQT